MFGRFFRSTAETTVEDLHKTPEKILEKGTLEQVKKLMESENKIVFNYGFSALHHAVVNKDVAILTYLVEEKKINPNFCSDNGSTALHRAASSGNIEAIGFLINEGADFELKNKFGLTMMSILRYGDTGRNAHLIPEVKDIITKKQSQMEASARYQQEQLLELYSTSIRNRKRSDKKSDRTRATEEQFLLKSKEEKHPDDTTCNGL